jgi:predicted DNA-binding transcriptional regulator YafY
MSRDEDKLIRQLSLLSFLLSRQRPFAAREIQEQVEGYADMTDDTFARRFFADRADLAKIGIEVRIVGGAETAETDEAQLYFLTPGDFRLPAVDFSPAERKALSLALAALDGRFAYARPLRLALTAILRGRHDPLREELEQVPIAFAPDEDARAAGKQLSRLEDAVDRGKTVAFAYPGSDGVQQERILDPYTIFLIQGHWYVVGRDHQREALRTFRLGRIKGTVRFPTEKPRDFVVPSDYDPEQYRARPPWLIGAVDGTATIAVGEDLAWWVKRLGPHVSWLGEDDGCATFAMPYADEFVLLSWLAGLGGCAEILQPAHLRDRARRLLLAVTRAHAGQAPGDAPTLPVPPPVTDAVRSPQGEDRFEPIAPEHLARAMALLSYLLDDERPELVSWQALREDLGLSRVEVEADLSLINVVNFGGGTYALTAEPLTEGVRVVREVMADAFSQPARLSPLMARALLLALDLVGDVLPLEGIGSLAAVRTKVRALIGDDRPSGLVIVDEVMPPDPAVVEVLNRAIRDHLVVSLEYFTASRHELSERLVEPYFLFHSPDGWYLDAYCRKADAPRTFKLERIRRAVATETVFVLRTEIDLSRRRKGEALIAGESATWATIVFTPRWRSYIEERGTRYAVRPDGAIEAQIPYMDELWIVQEVIRYLGDAVLHSPPSARRSIAAAAQALASRYEGDGPTAPPESPSGDPE